MWSDVGSPSVRRQAGGPAALRPILSDRLPPTPAGMGPVVHDGLISDDATKSACDLRRKHA